MAVKKAKDIMTKKGKVVTVGPKDKAADVIKALVKNNISGMPVVDADGVVVGVITEADVLTARSTTSVAKMLGETKPVVAHADATVTELADLLSSKKIKRVPIVDDKGKLAGVVSRIDVLKAKMKKQKK